MENNKKRKHSKAPPGFEKFYISTSDRAQMFRIAVEIKKASKDFDETILNTYDGLKEMPTPYEVFKLALNLTEDFTKFAGVAIVRDKNEAKEFFKNKLKEDETIH